MAGLNPPGELLTEDISYSSVDGASVVTHPVCLNTLRNGAFIGTENAASGYQSVPDGTARFIWTNPKPETGDSRAPWIEPLPAVVAWRKAWKACCVLVDSPLLSFEIRAALALDTLASLRRKVSSRSPLYSVQQYQTHHETSRRQPHPSPASGKVPQVFLNHRILQIMQTQPGKHNPAKYTFCDECLHLP